LEGCEVKTEIRVDHRESNRIVQASFLCGKWFSSDNLCCVQFSRDDDTCKSLSVHAENATRVRLQRGRKFVTGALYYCYTCCWNKNLADGERYLL
jgi:hypothetical protein